jgi:hypothetical protein
MRRTSRTDDRAPVTSRAGRRRGSHRGTPLAWLRPAAAAGILAYLAIATFPAEFRPMAPGLDPSWVYAINELPSTEAVFGRDVVFSFGPLGYLFVPLDIGSNLVQAVILWVVCQVVIVAVGVHHYRRTGRLEPLLAFALIFLVAGTVGELDEYRILVVLGLALSVAPRERTTWRAAAVFGALFAGTLSFTRLSTGFAAGAMLVVSTAAWAIRRDISVRDVLLFVVAPFTATISILTILLFGGPGTMLAWVAASWEYTSGYSEAMSFPGPTVLLVLVGTGITVFAVTAILLVRRVWAVAPVALALGVIILFGFRHGLVRHHARFVPAIVLGSIAVLVLVAGSRRAAIKGGAAAALVLGLALGAATVPECFCPWRPEALSPAQGWNGIVSVVRLGETRQRVAMESAVRLAEDRLPPPYVASARGGTVDAIPWEIAFMAANDLSWQPNPVLQTYSAYTSDLDRRTAVHFGSAKAPRSLLVQFVEIDARHPMLGAPATWRAILERYEPSGLPPAGGSWGQVALLHHRAEAVGIDPRPIGTTSGEIGRWVDIPRSEGLVFGSIGLRHDLGGRVASLLWRVDPVLMDLRLADGGAITVRFLPSTAENGLLLNHLPMTLQELLDLYGGALPRELTGFRIHGPGTASFQRDFEVDWTEYRWEPGDGSSGTAR